MVSKIFSIYLLFGVTLQNAFKDYDPSDFGENKNKYPQWNNLVILKLH